MSSLEAGPEFELLLDYIKRKLETTNEELQSTNEELETTNEELQSTNEELETTNTQLRQRSVELDYLNAYMESILASLNVGVAVVNRDLLVEVWNSMTEELWGLRSAEVHGKNLLNLDIGLPADGLRQPIRSCLSGEANSAETTLPAVNRRGKLIECRITVTPLIRHGSQIEGVVLLMEEGDQKPDTEAE